MQLKKKKVYGFDGRSGDNDAQTTLGEDCPISPVSHAVDKVQARLPSLAPVNEGGEV